MLLIDSLLPGASMPHTHLFLYKRERPTVSQMFSLKTLCTRGEEIGDWRGAKRVRRDIMSRRLGFFPLRIHPKTSPRFEIRNSPPKIIRSLSVTSNSSRRPSSPPPSPPPSFPPSNFYGVDEAKSHFLPSSLPAPPSPRLALQQGTE